MYPSTNTGSPSKPYFGVLTGFRALAAYLVFFDHNPLPKHLFGRFVYGFCSQFFIGVSFFFVLSGFLITIRYEDHFDRGWRRYLQNRFARIYPMYFIITSVSFVYYYSVSHTADNVFLENFFWTYLANITLLKGFFSELLLTGVAQGWTLTVEECFYMLAPSIFFLSRTIRLSWQVLGLYLICIVLWLLFRQVSFYGLFSSLPFLFANTFFGRCFDFFIGIQLARFYKQQRRLPFLKNHITALGAGFIISSILMLMVAQNGYEHTIYSPWGIAVNNTIVPVAIAIFLWGLLHEKTWLNRLFSTSLFSVLGKSSYVFYLIHMGVFNTLLKEYVTHNLFYNFPILIGLSILLYKLVEAPLNSYLKSL